MSAFVLTTCKSLVICCVNVLTVAKSSSALQTVYWQSFFYPSLGSSISLFWVLLVRKIFSANVAFPIFTTVVSHKASFFLCSIQFYLMLKLSLIQLCSYFWRPSCSSTFVKRAWFLSICCTVFAQPNFLLPLVDDE